MDGRDHRHLRGRHQRRHRGFPAQQPRALALPRLPEEVRRNGVIGAETLERHPARDRSFRPRGNTTRLCPWPTTPRSTWIDEIGRPSRHRADVPLFGSGAIRCASGCSRQDGARASGVTGRHCDCDPRAEPQYAAGRIGTREPAPAGQALHLHRHRAGRLSRPSSSATSWCARLGRRRVADQRCRARGTRRLEYDTSATGERQAFGRHGGVPANRRQCADVAAALKARIAELKSLSRGWIHLSTPRTSCGPRSGKW